MSSVALIILAAGNSSRLGRPKQHLPYLDKTLLERVIDEGLKAGLSPIIVVEGGAKLALPDGVTVVENQNWQLGMGTSIVKGVKALLEIDQNTERIIVSVCDQPYVSADLFLKLISEQSDTQTGIVASAYADTLGTPVLFTCKYFAELLQLKGKEGAKKIVNQAGEDISSVFFPQGDIDIDTESDYNNLIN